MHVASEGTAYMYGGSQKTTTHIICTYMYSKQVGWGDIKVWNRVSSAVMQ